MYAVPLEVAVYGDFACFTRPELKVERVSYAVMTPSAARGVLEAIFWKPEFRWRVREIQVLEPIRYFSILRNEVKHVASERSARGWESTGGGYIASDSDNRAQRNTLALRNVGYLIKADVVLRLGVKDDAAKYRDQFRRRVARGQCYAQPYLGCREFTASFEEPTAAMNPENISMDLGRMLLDVEFRDGNSGRGTPLFFLATLDRGVLRVPETEGESHAA